MLSDLLRLRDSRDFHHADTQPPVSHLSHSRGIGWRSTNISLLLYVYKARFDGKAASHVRKNLFCFVISHLLFMLQAPNVEEAKQLHPLAQLINSSLDSYNTIKEEQ